MSNKVHTWQVRDSRTGIVRHTYDADKAKVAYRRAETMNAQYGAERFVVRPIYEGVAPSWSSAVLSAGPL